MRGSFKPVSTTEDGILTNLFRTILFETGMINSISFLIDSYARKGGAKNKATIRKVILDGEMTWKSFTFLVFKILKVKRIKLTIELEHEVGEPSMHELYVTPTIITGKKKDKKKEEEK